MSALGQDLRYSIRTLFHSPGFTLIAVLLLTIAIGGNTAIFSVINAILLRPLSYPNSERVVVLEESNPQKGLNHFKFSPADFIAIRNQASVFDALAAYNQGSVTLIGDKDPERLSAAEVSSDFFRVLGVSPFVGREFLATDDVPGVNSQVVVLSHSLWQRHFGGDPGLLGKMIVLDGTGYTVIGVMPAEFSFAVTSTQAAELWMPAAYTQKYLGSHGHEIGVIGRLKPNVSLKQTQAEMDTIARRLAEHDPSVSAGWQFSGTRLQDRLVAEIKPYLMLLMAAVAFVLLIAIANMANLMVARAFLKHRDIAIRLSLGATRFQVIRQFLTESMLISLSGGALGVLLANSGIPVLLWLTGGTLLRQNSIGIDWSVLGFTLVISIGTGLLFGIAPAIFALNSNIMNALRLGSGGGFVSRAGRNWQKALLISEMALTLLLLIGAGLSIRSFSRILQVNSGFDSRNLLTMRLSLGPRRYSTAIQQTVFAERVLEGIRTIPGVSAVGLSNTFPLRHDITFSFTPEGSQPLPAQEAPNANVYAVSPGYFQTMKISLQRGRDFTIADRDGSAKVVIINESLAHQFFPGQDPLGKRIKEGGSNSQKEWMTIIAIAQDVKQYGLTSPVKAQFYEPYLQRPFPFFTLAIKTETAPLNSAAAVQRRILDIDPEQPAYDVLAMDQILSMSLANWRLSMALLSIFAIMSLVLAATGLYGVLTYAISQRTRELGVRAALGATRKSLVGLVLTDVLILSVTGVFLGTAFALSLMRVLSNVLYGIDGKDMWIYPVSALLLCLVAVFAGYVPATRAARIDPLHALRSD
ncbi:MAG TPA: ABC transporter permease [Candidatus Angelobacter sp.]